jgi:alkylated DNA nucleotide flippase Atl1
MELQEDVIVDIPENRIRFFGGSGKMLLPSPATVAALIKEIPANKLVTTELLRQKLTAQFNVQGTCPVTTQKAIQAIARDSSKNVAYWRIVNKNGGLIAKFPGGVEGHAALLRQEGYTIDTKGKIPKVKEFRESLVRFK